MPVHAGKKAFLAVLVAAVALGGFTSASASSPAQANRAAANIPQVFMAVSQVTNNYLLPDDTRGNPGTYLQVYGDDLPRGWTNSWRFVLVADPEGALVGQLRSEPAGACATVEGGAGSAVYLRACAEGNRNQWWRVRYVPGTGSSFQEAALAFVPDQNRGLALTAEGRGDAMVYLRQMWGGQPSLAQAWRLYPPSAS